MKKEKIMTRTIYTYSVKVMGIEDNAVTFKDYEIPVMDESKILAYIKRIDNSTFIPASVVNLEMNETLYGCTESEFMSVAHKLPPRKVYENKVEG